MASKASTTDLGAKKKQGSGGGSQGRDETPQLPGLEIVLNGTVKENVMGQYYIVSYGDNTALLRDFCRLTRIDVIG